MSLLTAVFVRLLEDARQFNLYILLQVLVQDHHVDFLLQNGERALILERASNQSGVQNLFVALVHEVNEWQITKLLQDGVLPVLEHGLSVFIVETVVANKQEHLVEHLLDVIAGFLLVNISLGIGEQEMQQVVDLISAFLQDKFLNELEVHPNDIIDYFHADDCERNDCLRK